MELAVGRWVRNLLTALLVLWCCGCGSDRGRSEQQWAFTEDSADETSTVDLRSPDGADDQNGERRSRGDTEEEYDRDAVHAAVEKWCDAWPEHYCEARYECGDRDPGAFVDFLAAPTESHCRAVTQWLGCGLAGAVDRDSVRVDAAAVSDCIRTAEANPCFDLSSCVDKAVHGVRELGAPCFGNIDCQSGLCVGYLAEVGDACNYVSGVCSRPLSEGASCWFDDDCAEQLRCLDRVCTGPGPRYASCDDDGDCNDGLRCWEDSGWRWCDGRGAAGESCDSDHGCEPGTYCRTIVDHQYVADPVCVPFVHVGGACDEDNLCAESESGLLVGCRDNVCTEFGGLPGDACDSRHDCWDDLGCVEGACEVQGTAGTACDDWADCHDFLYCVDGQCTYARGAGDSCSLDHECELRLTCVEGLCVYDHGREQCLRGPDADAI